MVLGPPLAASCMQYHSPIISINGSNGESGEDLEMNMTYISSQEVHVPDACQSIIVAVRPDASLYVELFPFLSHQTETGSLLLAAVIYG